MGTTAEKLSYLNETKTQLKDMLNLGGASLTTEPFRQYVDTLKNRYLYFMNNGTQQVWDNWDKVNGTGTTLTLNNTEEAPMSLVYKGNTYQYSTTGKNLFNESIMPTNTMNGIKWEYANNKIKISGTATSTYSQSSYTNISLPAGTYYFVKSGTTNLNFNAWFYNAGGTLIANSKLNNPFTISENATRLVIFVEGTTNGTSYNQEMNFMVSTTNGEYEPYTNGASPNPDYPQNIHVVSGDNSIEVCGRNLAYTGWAEDFVTRINKSNQATLETFDNRNCLKWKEQAGYGDYDNKYIFKTNWKENTQYTFSFDLYTTSTNSFGNLCIAYTDGTTTEINGIYNQWTHKIQTSTSGKTIKYLRANWRIGYSYVDLDTFMVYEGIETLPYEPYTGESYPINLPEGMELCKIGTYQDSIFNAVNGDEIYDSLSSEVKETLDYGSWYVEKKIGKVVLDGTQTLVLVNWRASDTSVGWGYNYVDNMVQPGNQVANIYSNKLAPAKYNDMYGKLIDNGISVLDNTNYGFIIRHQDTSLTTVNAINTYLSNNPIDVYYILKTPTYTKIEDSTLIEELESMKKSKEGQTNISQVNNDMPFILDITALKEM